MTHRQTMEALYGLLLGLFVAMLSSTVVTNALPPIISDLGGSAASYTWVVTSTLLATTVSMPLWGKLADLFSKKLLVQTALGIFLVGSVLAGLATSTVTLIGWRTLQGVGIGGLSSLVQVTMAAMIPPRERGRYNGYLGGSYAVATVAGPLVGGVIVDTPWLGWRWCFYFVVPLGLMAFVFIQRTLDLPVVKRKVKVDVLGALLITSGVSLLLIWTSLAGGSFGWASAQTVSLVGGGLAVLALAVFVESRVAEPVVPLKLFRSRTMVLAVVASACAGLMMFAIPVFLGQYFQLSRGKSPTVSGLLTVPMVLGLALASVVVGQIITRTGRWKRFIVLGVVLMTIAMSLLSTVRADTHLGWIAAFIAVCGLGLGMTQQNLVLAVQNSVRIDELGVASSTVTFFRTLGAAAGVAALGAIMAHRVASLTATGLADAGLPAQTLGDGRRIPDVASLPPAVADVVSAAYGNSIGWVYLAAVPLGAIALVAVLFLPETRLRTSNVSSDVSSDIASDDSSGDSSDIEPASALKVIDIVTHSPNGHGPAHGDPTDPPPQPTESDVRVTNTPATP